jgi:hypothetical protein
MKFKPGNLITHNPTKSRWIVLSNKLLHPVEPHISWESRIYKMEFEGLCILVGEKPQYWNINDRDTFVLTDQDLEPTDFVWRVDYAA